MRRVAVTMVETKVPRFRYSRRTDVKSLALGVRICCVCGYMDTRRIQDTMNTKDLQNSEYATSKNTASVVLYRSRTHKHTLAHITVAALFAWKAYKFLCCTKIIHPFCGKKTATPSPFSEWNIKFLLVEMELVFKILKWVTGVQFCSESLRRFRSQKALPD